MKSLIGIIVVIALMLGANGFPAIAQVIHSFPGWDNLIENSPDIIVVRCSQTPDFYKDHGDGPTGALYNSKIEIISVLKGATNSGPEALKMPELGSGCLSSMYVPRQGEYYLIFSIFNYDKFQASENYRIVPLGLNYSMKNLGDKSLNQQINFLLQWRLDRLNLQMQQDQAEKDRLEQALQK